MKLMLGAVIASSVALSACTTTKQFADVGFHPPAGDYKLIVMRPDISVGLLTAGGSIEHRDDWTDQALANILTALTAQQGGHGGTVKVATTREEAGDPRVVADLDRLHDAVGKSIRVHKYSPLKLPTKTGKFDWTLGDSAVAFGASSGYDYALFLHAEDSFSSSGRVALQAVEFMGCMVGVCYLSPGGQQAAFASLVDLHTGQIVWFNQLASNVGDMRTPDGADKVVANLLDRMRPGSDVRAKAKKRPDHDDAVPPRLRRRGRRLRAVRRHGSGGAGRSGVDAAVDRIVVPTGRRR